jgi:hypothetical protein
LVQISDSIFKQPTPVFGVTSPRRDGIEKIRHVGQISERSRGASMLLRIKQRHGGIHLSLR